MITSVQQAREKWCPFDKGKNAQRETSAGTCIGPDCMMWRYWVPPPGVAMEKMTKHGIPDKDKKGYCGLAGVYGK